MKGSRWTGAHESEPRPGTIHRVVPSVGVAAVEPDLFLSFSHDPRALSK